MRPARGNDRWRALLAGVMALLVVLAVVTYDDRAGLGDAIDALGGARVDDRSAPVPDDYLKARSFPDEAGRDGQAVTLAPEVTLRPGADGTLPVRPRWVVQLSAPETIAVDGDVVYAADEYLDAFRLADGELLWNTGNPDGESGLHADGGVYIGLDGPDTVRAIAPWNYDIAADRRTGELRHFGFTGAPGTEDLRALPAPRPPDYRTSDDGMDVMTARATSGRVAWSIHVEVPWFGSVRPIAIPGGLVLMTASGLLVVLDHA